MNNPIFNTEINDIEAEIYPDDLDEYYREAHGDYYGEADYDFLDEALDGGEGYEWEDYFREGPETLEGAGAEDYMPYVLTEDDLNMLDESGALTEALREALHEDYQDSPFDQVEEALDNILGALPPMEGFSFKKVLGQIATKGLPLAGAAVGTYFGGPAGTAIGGKVGGSFGQLAGKALSGKHRPQKQPSRPTAGKASARGGSTAAARLLQLTQNPDILKSLLALSLGSNGRKSVKAGSGGPSVQVGGYMNLLKQLVNQAATDADELQREADDIPDYLIDSEGEFLGDPTVPGDRAEALYETLSNAESQRMVDAIESEGYFMAGPDLAGAPYRYWRSHSRRRFPRRYLFKSLSPPFYGYRRPRW